MLENRSLYVLIRIIIVVFTFFHTVHNIDPILRPNIDIVLKKIIFIKILNVSHYFWLKFTQKKIWKSLVIYKVAHAEVNGIIIMNCFFFSKSRLIWNLYLRQFPRSVQNKMHEAGEKNKYTTQSLSVFFSQFNVCENDVYV